MCVYAYCPYNCTQRILFITMYYKYSKIHSIKVYLQSDIKILNFQTSTLFDYCKYLN